jgi:Flp pilus assembly protein TadD
LQEFFMKKPRVFLTGLGVTVGLVSTLTVCIQPSVSVEAMPTLMRKNPQPSPTSMREAEAYNNQGVELAEKGNFGDAIAAFNRAIKINPTYEKAHNNLGLALGSQDKFSEAAAAFNRALEINPRNFETFNNLGIALGSQGKFLEAVAAFNRAIQINPKEPTSHQNLAVAFWSQGKLPEAVASMQKARQLYSAQNNTEGVQQVEQILQQIQSTP